MNSVQPRRFGLPHGFECYEINGAFKSDSDLSDMVFLVPRHGTSWTAFQLQYRLLEEQTTWQPVMVLANDDAKIYESECRQNGLHALSVTPSVERQDRGQFDGLDRFCRKTIDQVPGLRMLGRLVRHDRIAHSTPVSIYRYLSARRLLRRQKQAFLTLLSEQNPFAVLVVGDRELGVVPPLLAAAGELGIQTVVSGPVFENREGSMQSRTGCSRFLCRARDRASWVNILAARHFPDQVYEHSGAAVLFSPGWLIRALAAEGMLCRKPWTPGGGASSAILLDNAKTAAAIERLGTPAEKIRLVGRIELDMLHEAYVRREAARDEISAEAGFAEPLPACIVSIPCYAEQEFQSWEDQFLELEWLFVELAQAPLNVILVLHPKSKFETYEALADKHGLHLTRRSTSTVLPVADILVCSNSTIIEWATICGIPTINYDYVRYQYKMLRLPGVITTETRSAFAENFRELASSQHARKQLAEATARQDARGMFDGCAGERFIAVLQDIRDGGRLSDRENTDVTSGNEIPHHAAHA